MTDTALGERRIPNPIQSNPSDTSATSCPDSSEEVIRGLGFVIELSVLSQAITVVQSFLVRLQYVLDITLNWLAMETSICAQGFGGIGSRPTAQSTGFFQSNQALLSAADHEEDNPPRSIQRLTSPIYCITTPPNSSLVSCMESAPADVCLAPTYSQQAAFPGDDVEPRIPLEIQERVIDHLWDEPYYLIPCRLVCRAWCIRSSQHFYRFIRIDNLRSLKRFSTLLLSSDSAAYWARDLLSSKETQNDDVCAHLIPHYMARKLLHLHHLEFSAMIDHQLGPPTLHYHSNPSARPAGVSRYDAIHCHFPSHPSMFMHLSQFHSVSSFTLTGYHFTSFNDLRKMVGALRVLRRLELIGVTWENRGDPLKCQIKTMPSQLVNLTLRDCTSDFIGVSFWVWTVPNLQVALEGGSRVPSKIPASHPQICVDDACALVDITDFISKAKSLSRREHLQGISYEWTQMSETSWIVACGQDTPMYPEPLFVLTLETDILQSPSSGASRRVGNNRALTKVFSLEFDLLHPRDLYRFEWRRLDHVLIGLHNLRSLRITLRCKRTSPVWEKFDQFLKETNMSALEFWKNRQVQDIEIKWFEEQWSQDRKESLKLVQEEMPLMKPILSLDFTWLY